MEKIKSENYLINEHIRWFIKLRWLAILGIVGAVYIAQKIIVIPLPALRLYGVAVFLVIYNTFFSFLVFKPRAKTSKGLLWTNSIAYAQISLDLLSLAFLIHFSGGIENPFIFYFIFHMIIASILLSRRGAFLQATYAIFLFLFLVFLEYQGYVAHYCLKPIVPYCLHKETFYIFSVSVAFISTLYIAVYMASFISKQLKERERNLEKANKLLNEKDRIKSEYVLRVTHDIKEDLSTIQSCIEPVTEGITGQLNEKQLNLLQRAKKRSKSLIFYVNALLGITKMKLDKKFKTENFSFPQLIQDIAENITPRARNKNIEFTIDVDSSIKRIEGVRVYIQESILNILANAIKYTPKGGKVSLKLTDKENSFLIKIEDNGIGIPEDELEYVFDEFYRAQNAREQEKLGTGLGLAIAKQVIERHKGKIWVESKKGEGTIFYLELPKQI